MVFSCFNRSLRQTWLNIALTDFISLDILLFFDKYVRIEHISHGASWPKQEKQLTCTVRSLCSITAYGKTKTRFKTYQLLIAWLGCFACLKTYQWRLDVMMHFRNLSNRKQKQKSYYELKDCLKYTESSNNSGIWCGSLPLKQYLKSGD